MSYNFTRYAGNGPGPLYLLACTFFIGGALYWHIGVYSRDQTLAGMYASFVEVLRRPINHQSTDDVVVYIILQQ